MTFTTCSRTCRRCERSRNVRHVAMRNVAVALGTTVIVAGLAAVTAQEIPPDALLNVAPDSWPTYHGDYSGQRHSRITQITPSNVQQLTLAWAFQTGATQQIKGTPTVVNGTVYLTTPDHVWAIDA